MKKAWIPLLGGLVLGAGIMYAVLAPRSPEGVKSAVPTSFAQVTGKLDAGGDFYVYFNAEKAMAKVTDFIGKIGQASLAETAGAPADRAEAEKIFRIVSRFFAASGLSEIGGVGASTVEMEPGLFHSKFVLYHRPDAGQGLIWHLAGNEIRELTELNMLPADTVLARSGEFQAGYLWTWLKTQLEKADLPGAVETLKNAEGGLLENGVPLEKILASLTGRMGYLLTLDQEKKASIPAGTEVLEIPEPAAALIFSVADGTIFDLLAQKLTFAEASESDGWKKLKLTLPPMPFAVEPLIAWKNDVLIIASNPGLFQAMLDTEAKGGGLTAGPEFKKYSAQIPARGNGFQYVGSRLFQTVHGLLTKAAAEAGKKNDSGIFHLLDEAFSKEMALYAVQQHGDDGMVFISNHSFNPALIFFLPAATAAAGIKSALPMRTAEPVK